MNTNNIRQFEKYYNDEMEPGEKASFEKLLSEDLALSAAFKEYLSIYEALSDRDTLDLRIKLKEIREENARKKYGNDFFSHGYNWLWMAALLTIIISFTVIVSLLIAKAEMNTQVVTGLENIETEKYSALDRELIKFEKRNMDFKLKSPDDELFISRKDPMIFEWTVNSTDPLILELLDWEGKIVFSSKKPVESPYTVKKKLPGGITVYRFRTDKESYCIGFLFLR
jgi:hypothetical protein